MGMGEAQSTSILNLLEDCTMEECLHIADLAMAQMRGMEAGPAQPKCAWPSEFDVGRMQEKPKSKEKGSLEGKKSRSSAVKAKDPDMAD
ncbi:hypothetical protein COCNU_11G000670 [Cocos nucifera]|uniref:Uncharacterized protein n=1 Tax=Cocos nucifera TaxID=13894 RepID=A0A8K0INH1_COCNU|nr:hypothetical protein COCNU_11G000670 [Cocos nucifera]